MYLHVFAAFFKSFFFLTLNFIFIRILLISIFYYISNVLCGLKNILAQRFFVEKRDNYKSHNALRTVT